MSDTVYAQGGKKAENPTVGTKRVGLVEPIQSIGEVDENIRHEGTPWERVDRLVSWRENRKQEKDGTFRKKRKGYAPE